MKKHLSLGRIAPQDKQKEQLDSETPYFTLLPTMDEGFHVGYRPSPGIQCDGNQKPHEWLENFAKYIRTQGEDVGYSIPDVLASEQQLRRLARLPYETAMRHQEMLDYRGALAVLLLWDQLAVDPQSAELHLEALLNERDQSPFPKAVRAALLPKRGVEGVRVFTLSRPRSDHPETVPFCLLSDTMGLMPASNPGDLSGLLPPAVTWYDREHKRFQDPCGFLTERMRLLLIPRLRLLAQLNENPEWQSPLYSPEASICALLMRFAQDAMQPREEWRQRLLRGEEAAVSQLRTRLLAVYGLARRSGSGTRFTMQTLSDDPAVTLHNPLIRQLVPVGKPLPALALGEDSTLYLADGVPFARHSTAYGLEPACEPGEEAALKALEREIGLLDQYDDGWRQEMKEQLHALAQKLAGRTGIAPVLPALLKQWSEEYAVGQRKAERRLNLRDPEDTRLEAMQALALDILHTEERAFVQQPFSDGLLMIRDAEQSPFGDTPLSGSLLAENCGEPLYFVPPLSPALAAWLEGQGEQNDPAAPGLKSITCFWREEAQAMEVSLCLQTAGSEGKAPGTVTFTRFYPIKENAESGGAWIVSAEQLPTVTVWPNVRLTGGRWRKYYLHAHRTDILELYGLDSEGWKQGVPHAVKEEGGRRQGQSRSWKTACVDRFPAYGLLKRGGLSFGVLVNDRPFQLLRREDAAVIGIDFGSISTTVMLRQGEKTQPASLPRCLHGTLLCGNAADERFLAEELLPRSAILAGEANASTYYSVMDLFTDEPERWRDPLLDGHIYYPQSLTALLRKGESTLYYDLKWSEEEYILRCLRLFLKQVMIQASLAARLWGSSALSWRVSMPGALPTHRQEAFLDMARGLAREVEQETGMPLSKTWPPVLYAAENQADGLYFRSRNEVNSRGGYLNMDIGGGTTDISLWLNNAVHATAEVSLLLGCRQMLYTSLAEAHLEEFERDFANGSGAMEAAAQEIVRSLRKGGTTTRLRQKNMLLMDDFFATYAQPIRDTMAAARAQGRITYVEGLLLFHIGFLFYLCGLLLNRAYGEAELAALLPERMELCIAGNGGQLLKSFSPDQMDRLCRLALGALEPSHPVRALLPIQSAEPKQEVALGLLSDEGVLFSTLQGVERWNGTAAEERPPQETVLTDYLKHFCTAFPQAANLLLNGLYESVGGRGEVRLTPTAGMELSTIWANERERNPEDDFTVYVRCLAGVKRLWRL